MRDILRNVAGMKKCAAECSGSFALVFAGTGAVIVDDVSGGAVTHLGVALTFGLIVLAIIYSLGAVSGAHVNSAVTLGFFAAGRLRGGSVISFVTSQCLGAPLLGALAAVPFSILFRESETL